MEAITNTKNGLTNTAIKLPSPIPNKPTIKLSTLNIVNNKIKIIKLKLMSFLIPHHLIKTIKRIITLNKNKWLLILFNKLNKIINFSDKSTGRANINN